MRALASFLAAAMLGLALADSILQPLVPTNVAGSTTIIIPTPTTSPSPGSTEKELSVCCCCVYEPQPDVDDYVAECSRKGVQAVCGNEPAGDPEYSLGGLEGQPEEIAKVCSSIRCGPVKFVD
ncbi:hypothetical protein Hte_006036 [Hypoxylon texense]